MDQQGQAGDSHVVDVASWAQELIRERATLNSTAQLGAPWPPPGCIIISKVPHLTRNVDEGEYNPQYVSIGPYHRTSNLQLARDDDKMRSLDAVLSAASPGMTVDVSKLINELAHLVGRASSCYADRFDDMKSDKFVRMLLLDGCYILSRFRDVHSRPTNGAATASNSEPLLPTAGGGDMREAAAVVRDVFYLAENQIPFFVLEKIDQLTTLDGKGRAVNGIWQYALYLLENQQYAMVAPERTVPPGNLLHLLHMHLQPTVLTGSGERNGGPVGRWRSAMEYYYAGVKFKSRVISKQGNVRCILDVKLDSGGGTLEVPCLNIDSETWRLLRNLMELEQRNPTVTGRYVTAYCVFMSQIACTVRDVEMLSRRGIIVHVLGNHVEVAECFTNLCKGIVFDPDNPDFNYLRATFQVLEKRFRSYPRRWMAWLRRKYFTNPWLAVGLLAAVIGLACTVVQAVYSVLSYKNGSN